MWSKKGGRELRNPTGKGVRSPEMVAGRYLRQAWSSLAELEQWSSNFMSMNYVGAHFNTDCGASPLEFPIHKSGLGPKYFLFWQVFRWEADAADLETSLGEPLIQSPVMVKVDVKQNREPQDPYGLLTPTALSVCGWQTYLSLCLGSNSIGTG